MVRNHKVVIPLGGWWNSRGIGGPDEWHYLQRARMGGGHFWTLCQEHMTMSRPRTLRASPPDQETVCEACEKARDGK